MRVQKLPPPPFAVGFVGLTSFSDFEIITDYDYHYYDESWNVITSNQIRLVSQARREKLEIMQERKKKQQAQKSRMCCTLEEWL